MFNQRLLYFAAIAYLRGTQSEEEGTLTVDGILTVNQGILKGLKEETPNGKEFYSYLGIPYARPPVGSLRYKDPIPAEKWEGVLDATEEPAHCFQLDPVNAMKDDGSEFKGSEDCLFLSAYTPRPAQLDAKLPVLVYIHGGGFTSGGSSEYKPYILLEEDIVLVVTQYRLGALGFLSAGDKVLPGNFGMKDQTMALKWVQQNIINFGGDPDSVTLIGQSSGAINAHMHMLSPWSKGLFHRVIAQSGSALFLPHSNRTLRDQAKKFGTWVNCDLDEGTEEFVSCLQEVEVGKILKAGLKFPVWGVVPSPLVSIVDGDFLPDNPIKLIKEKKYNKADLMTGITRDEGVVMTMMLFSNPTLVKRLGQYFGKLAPVSLYIEDEKDALYTSKSIYDHYLKGKPIGMDSNIELREMFGDRLFTVPHDVGTMLHAMNDDIKVYRYELQHFGQLSLGDYLNAPDIKGTISHGDDLIYLFEGGPILNKQMENPDDLKIRHFFKKMWTNFAATGNPTPDNSLGFTWTPATPESFQHLKITLQPHMEEDQREEVRKFWLSLPISSFENAFDYYEDTKEIPVEAPVGKEEL